MRNVQRGKAALGIEVVLVRDTGPNVIPLSDIADVFRPGVCSQQRKSGREPALDLRLQRVVAHTARRLVVVLDVGELRERSEQLTAAEGRIREGPAIH